MATSRLQLSHVTFRLASRKFTVLQMKETGRQLDKKIAHLLQYPTLEVLLPSVVNGG